MVEEEHIPSTIDQLVFNRNIPQGPLTDDQLLDLAMGRWEKFSDTAPNQEGEKASVEKPSASVRRGASDTHQSPKPLPQGQQNNR